MNVPGWVQSLIHRWKEMTMTEPKNEPTPEATDGPETAPEDNGGPGVPEDGTERPDGPTEGSRQAARQESREDGRTELRTDDGEPGDAPYPEGRLGHRQDDGEDDLTPDNDGPDER